MNRTRIAMAALPAASGLLAWLLLGPLGWLPNYVIYLRASTSYLLLGLGIGLSLLAGGLLIASRWFQLRATADIDAARTAREDEHRQFLRRLDHELKNPLTTLQVEIANLDAEDDSVRLLREQALRLNELVIQLRKLAEIGAYTLERETIDLSELLRGLTADWQADADGAQREISLNVPRVPWPLPTVQGDPDLIYLALYNVVQNAVKFTRPGDLIQVRAYEDGRAVSVEIADTGQGIPEEDVPHVWEELFRSKAARGLPGSGLGLALVKAIVERHGGETVLRSRSGQGTVVTVRLPL